MTSVSEISAAMDSFYVPRFEVKIEGAGLPRDVLSDVIEVTYSDDIDQLDSCELTVNNANDDHHVWPPRRGDNNRVRRFRYIGSETEEDLQDKSTTNRYTLFEPCDREVELHMGYGGALELMMTATFTTMEPSFESTGASTLKVRGLNILHQLRRKKYSDQWSDAKPSEIAEKVASRRRRGKDATRFDMMLCINENAKRDETPIRMTVQKNAYDIDFLWHLARERGYVLVVREEDDFQPRHIYFGPSGGVSNCNTSPDAENEFQESVTYQLQWGRSLIDFTPRLTTANQFSSVTVNGWDRRTQKPISEKIDYTDREIARRNPDLERLLCDAREELVVDEPVFTKEEAKRRARAILSEQQKQMVKVSGTTVGLPRLRAGSIVEIQDVGSRLSGNYFLTKTRHVVNDSGYITSFEARREVIKGVVRLV